MNFMSKTSDRQINADNKFLHIGSMDLLNAINHFFYDLNKAFNDFENEIDRLAMDANPDDENDPNNALMTMDEVF